MQSEAVFEQDQAPGDGVRGAGQGEHSDRRTGSSAFPLAGGEYAITTRVLGRLPGFVVLGLILVTQLLVVAVIALGVGTYLAVLFPHLDAAVAAAVTTLLATVPAVFDLKLNAWVTGISWPSR